jgi:hypothetical protein
MMRFRTAALLLVPLFSLAGAGCAGEPTLPETSRARLIGYLDGKRWSEQAWAATYPNGRVTVVTSRTVGGRQQVFRLMSIPTEDGYRLTADPAFEAYYEVEEGTTNVVYRAHLRSGTVSYRVVAPNGHGGGRAVGSFDVVLVGSRGEWRFRGSFDAFTPVPASVPPGS